MPDRLLTGRVGNALVVVAPAPTAEAGNSVALGACARLRRHDSGIAERDELAGQEELSAGRAACSLCWSQKLGSFA